MTSHAQPSPRSLVRRQGSASQFMTDSFQRGLAYWNRERLAPAFPSDDWADTIERGQRMLRLEGGFIEALRAEISDEAAAAPTDPDAFIACFERYRDHLWG